VSNVQGVRPVTALILALASTVGSWVLLQTMRVLTGGFPTLSWLGLVPLVAVVVLVLVLSWQIRRWTRGSTRVRPTPQRGRGTLVGAQAAALGGAVLLGWYLANAGVHLRDADIPGERAQLVRALVHAMTAAGLCASGFLGQAWCRVPPSGEDDDDDGAIADGGLAYGGETPTSARGTGPAT
jgi:hypothetical protein